LLRKNGKAIVIRIPNNRLTPIIRQFGVINNNIGTQDFRRQYKQAIDDFRLNHIATLSAELPL
jgi:hypothetical protein